MGKYYVYMIRKNPETQTHANSPKLSKIMHPKFTQRLESKYTCCM